MVGCWDEHQWHSAGVDGRKLQQIGQMTTARHVAEVDDKKDDGQVDTQTSGADYYHKRIPCAHASSSLPPCADSSFLQKQ